MQFNLDQYTSQRLAEGEKLLAFQGAISSDGINEMLTKAESFFIENDISTKLRKKVYNILVESLQNLYHHSLDAAIEGEKYPAKFSYVLLNQQKDCIMLTTGNIVMEPKVKALSQKIDKINTLSQDDLKEMYKFILNHQKLSAKGGGGLGMIDIARKSGHKMTYEFYELSKEHYFYILNVKITEDLT